MQWKIHWNNSLAPVAPMINQIKKVKSIRKHPERNETEKERSYCGFSVMGRPEILKGLKSELACFLFIYSLKNFFLFFF